MWLKREMRLRLGERKELWDYRYFYMTVFATQKHFCLSHTGCVSHRIKQGKNIYFFRSEPTFIGSIFRGKAPNTP